MTHAPLDPENAPDELPPLTKSPTLMVRWRRAFGRAAPGGASSTPSPTPGRTSGISAPGVAEEAQLQEAAAQHGYKGDSGLAADIVLAFITGRFTANLPLSEDRRRTHIFRAQVLRQLNRIGVNINQIARALNSDHTPPDIRQHLTELHNLLELIAEALRQPTDPETEAAA
ncbi:MobC family plasmid mobilization relaxosome protein [Streptomyces sp. NPDC096080]|uniref:MobC family plasmid mobilization relaxosome protein n=1 Tax=Streptomyces sp. NPDC096080 TaxID=3156693 RepID=UPI00332B0BF1